jgi:hypothetical protein
MAKRKREPKKQRYTEEIHFTCAGCYDRAQKKLRKANVQFKTSFLKRLSFGCITDEVREILDDSSCEFEIVKENL